MTKIAVLLPCYNEEETIRRCINSILTQDFEEPFDLILSDHSSKDNTFAIMKSMYENYDGTNTIHLFQCPKDTKRDSVGGIGEHLNWLMDRLDYDFYIMSTGDDIEYPNRVRLSVEAWRETGADFITTSQRFVHLDGTYNDFFVGETRHISIIELCRDSFAEVPCCNGASAWTRNLWDLFGPLPIIHSNDLIMPVWGALASGCYHVGQLTREYYVTGKQAGKGSQYHIHLHEKGNTELGKEEAFRRKETMCFETVSLKLHVRQLILKAFAECDKQVDVSKYNTLAAALGMATRTLVAQTEGWSILREAMALKQIRPETYPL